MKSVISLFSMALIALSALSSLCPAQNVTINLEPINPPIQIPAPGGAFDYNVTVNNTGATPQTFDAWIMVQLPDSTWYGPVLGPFTLTLPASATSTRLRTQNIPGNAPPGTYLYEGRVGDYPNTIWDSDGFAFTKSFGGEELWVARYEGLTEENDYATKLVLDDQGNVYVTGYSNVASYPGVNFDYATLKYNSSGQLQWSAYFNGPGNGYDQPFCLALDEVGNVYVSGYSWGIGTNFDYATVKYNSAGEQLWEARYNGSGHGWDYTTSLAVDEEGNVYVTGYSEGSEPIYDYATIKYNSAGQQQWVARYNGPGNGDDEAYSLAVDGNGNVFVTGESRGNGTGKDYATIKYNSAGEQQWVARYNRSANSDDEATNLAVDQDGYVYVTGHSIGTGAPSNWDYATIKYDSTGLQQWEAIYDGPGHSEERAFDLALDEDNNVYITGFSDGDYPTSDDYATIKYNSAGQQLWVARYNGPANGWDWASDLDLDGNGNVYVTGWSRGIGGAWNDDYATIKYNSAGQEQWVMRYGDPVNSIDRAYSLAVNDVGEVYVTGRSSTIDEYTGFNYLTIKYSGSNPAVAGTDWQPVEAVVLGVQEPVMYYQLHPCYPNPFNATTAISYQLQASSHVSLKVYDTAGRMVEILVSGWREAGTHELTFDAGDLPSGVYFCKIQAGDFNAVQKMVLMK